VGDETIMTARCEKVFKRAPHRAVWAAALALLLTTAGHVAGQPSDFASVAPGSVGLSPERLGLLDAYMKRQVHSGHIPGYVTLLARHGKIAAFDVYGEADSDRHAAMNKNTIFRIYSQTKVVTGVARTPSRGSRSCRS
jgi:CubicO group peptidase (beta-lactamase class C family)